MEDDGHRLRFLRKYSVPKTEGNDRNEDFAATSDRKGVYALSDGASISYDSATWAHIVAISYVQTPSVTRPWITEAISKFDKKYDREALPWMAQAALDRGSFASLLGIQLHQPNEVEVFAVGDTEALLCDGDGIVATFPYSVSAEFSASPLLLSTSPSANTFVQEENYPSSRTVYWDLQGLSTPSVYCMTDALAQWALERKEEGNTPIRLLSEIRTARHFGSFVRRERGAGRLKRDDTTLLVFGERDVVLSRHC